MISNNYKDERIKAAMAIVGQKDDALREAKKAYAEANHKAAEVIQEVFTEKIAKPGEIMRTKRENTPFYFERIECDAYGYMQVVCYPQKKDGTPSRSIRKMWISDFADL